ncbi:MAG TPA: TIGR02587 family membrane protein [Armatimonadota bacterium]|nr:TIGR02587 family membrane protein [Armatimonadota bacterium]
MIDRYGWKQEADDLMRGLAGGAILGLPLLYTMEMWWHGMTLSEWHLLGILGVVLLANFLFSILSGFRDSYSFSSALSESITSVGIGLLFSAAILALIGELSMNASPSENVGKIVLESAAVSIGVCFANAQVRGRSRTGDDTEEGAGADGQSGGKKPGAAEEDLQRLQLQADFKDAAATGVGATAFALNIAPTEEVLMIAVRLSPWQQLLILGASLALCYIILFASGFEDHQVHVKGIFQHPVAETMLTGALSLGVAFVLLWLLGQREAMSHPATAVATVVTLGLPAVVGGAAGRLIV